MLTDVGVSFIIIWFDLTYLAEDTDLQGNFGQLLLEITVITLKTKLLLVCQCSFFLLELPKRDK